MGQTVPAATRVLSRVPLWLRHTVLARAEWNSCTLERSCFGPMHDPTPAVPFHHLAVRLDRPPMKMGFKAEGRRSETDLPHDHVSVIPADASVTSWWNRPVDFACLYFTQQAIASAVGEDMLAVENWELRLVLAVRAPAMSQLIRALAKDAASGQPYGKLRGEAMFQQLATLLVADGRVLRHTRYKAAIGDRRVRRALDFIHSQLWNELSLQTIAEASETSLFYLTRLFREATGLPIWRYVSQRRVELATGLMRDQTLTLGEVAALSGFASYSTFAATFVAERGISPSTFRRRS
jgi:AraC family transcriptional regulator